MIRCWSFFLFISLFTNCFANDFNVNEESSINSKIVGGSEAKPGEFPYMVSIQCYGDEYGTYVHCCGGSIYNEITILTHINCGIFGEPIRVVAGEHNFYADDKTEQVRRTSFFRGYNSDLLIIGLEQPLTFNEYVQPIVLPEQSSIPEEGTNCTVTGWGTIGGNDTAIYSVLRKVVVPTVSYETCQNSSGITDISELCTATTGGVGICQYDIGSPLVVNDNQGRTNLQIGIAAYSSCGIQGNYDVYLRLSAYSDIIRAEHPYPPSTTEFPPTTAGAEISSVTLLKIIVVGIFILFV